MHTHEAAHPCLPAFPTKPSDSQQEVECTTELTAAVVGAGLFGANYAFNFRRSQEPLSQRWESPRLGCSPRLLTRATWKTQIGVRPVGAARVGRGDAGAVRVTLKPHLFCNLRTAIKSLRHYLALLAGTEGGRGSSKATRDERRGKDLPRREKDSCNRPAKPPMLS